MKKAISFSVISAWLIFEFIGAAAAGDIQEGSNGWKAGVARIELEKLFGHEIFVMGYANDVMAYIP